LQSWNWGEFCQKEGNKIWRWGIYDNNNLISTAFFYKIQARRGTFIFVPHGPVIMKHDTYNIKQILEIFLEQLKKIAKEEKCDFIRIAPIWEKNDENNRIFKELNFRDAPIHIHPELTWELNIALSEEELLNQMRKTTRYLIRQAQKNDVKIIESHNLDDVEKFEELNKKTVNRHHFVPFPLSYLKNEFLAFLLDNQISIFLGKYQEELISAGIFVFWQGTAFYHHGASSLKYPKIPVSYLLLWEAIREAKERGCKKFNFWGIAPENEKNHPWAGLSLFKMGFGGYKKEYVKTQDLPLSKKYYLTYVFEKIRRAKRGL
jgi:lipid II:glycine glycyltransferase (peptidoglycan interpeptide bridge formation enzyme)